MFYFKPYTEKIIISIAWVQCEAEDKSDNPRVQLELSDLILFQWFGLYLQSYQYQKTVPDGWHNHKFMTPTYNMLSEHGGGGLVHCNISFK